MKAAYDAALAAADAAAAHAEAKRAELLTAETTLLKARPADVKAHTALVAKRDHAENELRLATLDCIAADKTFDEVRDAYHAAMREATHVEADEAIESVVAIEEENATMRERIAKNEALQAEYFASKIHRRCRPKAPYPGSPPRFESLAEVRAEWSRRHPTANPLAGAKVAA